MAIIPLRVYNNEIEGLIDTGQLDEAVAHCRHILATFPKHIATYRLLGKAHLEQQRISDATDVFQRVLSAIPDDFTANVGMSIIREDENNLDASIWHMELAYEAQPSNVAIQDELRRLYGRRDGVQPPKVRLTRGALARMYAKGGLYEQAIAELRAAINEDPNRPDIQLLLAQMFFQLSQRIEAVESSADILKKLPFCLAANQILAVCLPEAQGTETRKNYRQMAVSMDPYFAHADLEAINSELVPDNAVNIEKLDWKPGIQPVDLPQQPGWATSLGISVEKTAEETIPDWLKEAELQAPVETSETAQPTVTPFVWDTQEVEKIITDETKPEVEIPDWMKDAGWKSATGEAIQEPVEAVVEPPIDEEEKPEDLAKAEFPDWLRGIAPEGILDDKPSETESKEKDVSIPWLEKHQPGPTDSIIQWLEEKKPETPAELPVPETTPVEPAEEEIPEWLKDLDIPIKTTPKAVSAFDETPQSVPATSAFIEEPIETQSKAFTTFDSFSGEDEKIESHPEVEEIPQESQVSEDEGISTTALDELPDWIKALAAELPKTSLLHPPKEELGAEELPTVEEMPVEEITIMPTEATETELPAVDEERVEEITSTPIEDAAPELPVVDEEQVEEISSPLTEAAETELPAIEGEGNEAIPTLTESAESKLPATVEEILKETSAEALLEQDEGLADFVEKAALVEGPDIPEAVVSTEPVISEEALIEEIPAIVEHDVHLEEAALEGGKPGVEAQPESLDWLEGLSDDEELNAGELSMLAEEERLATSDWVKLEADAETSMPEIEPEEEPPAVPAEEIPEWIRGLGEPVEEELEETVSASTLEPEIEIPQAEELPDWLKELEPPEVKEETVVSADEALPWSEDELPDWIKELTETAPPIIEAVPIEAPAVEELRLPTPLDEISPGPGPEEQILTSEVETGEEPVTILPVELEAVAPTVVEEIGESPVDETPLPPADESIPEIEIAEVQISALDDAREAIAHGQSGQAAEIYSSLIKRNTALEDILKDLKDAVYRFPVDVNLWVCLGDAYFRTNDLQEALNSYTKAEELVR